VSGVPPETFERRRGVDSTLSVMRRAARDAPPGGRGRPPYPPMISAFTNTFRIPELRARVLFTLAMLVIVRIGAAITCPGVNATVIQHWFQSQIDNQSGGNVAALFIIFSGGALENCAIFSLGVMPYISASIMMQLLTAVIPQLGRLAREDGGRQKIMQYTRYAIVVLCLFQGYLLAISFQHPESYHTIL